jgi:hypothetical protein
MPMTNTKLGSKDSLCAMWLFVLTGTCVVVLTFALVVMIGIEPYRAIEAWNKLLEPHRVRQNALLTESSSKSCANDSPFGRAPGMCLAQDCPFQEVRAFHSDIVTHRERILEELTLLTQSNVQPVPMIDLDSMQRNAFPDQTGWSTQWIKLSTSYSGTSDHLPCLAGITRRHSDFIVNLFVSIMQPGTCLRQHRGPNSGTLRYHYGLDVPDGDLGLEINGQHQYKWKNGEGIVWDDVELHRAWNNTSLSRAVLFVDVVRPFPWWLDKLNRAVIAILTRTRHIRSMQQILKAHGRYMD